MNYMDVNFHQMMAGFLLVLTIMLYNLTWPMVIIGVIVWYIAAITGISSGYHRLASHDQFKAPNWYYHYMTVCGMIVSAGSPLHWAVTHRMHHIYSDTENDPHSPTHKGWFAVFMNLWPSTVLRLDRRAVMATIKRHPILKEIDRSYRVRSHMFVFFLLCLGLPLGSILPILSFYVIPTVLASISYGFLNVWTHKSGSVINSPIADFLIPGEGAHKDHHERPSEIQAGGFEFNPVSLWINWIGENDERTTEKSY